MVPNSLITISVFGIKNPATTGAKNIGIKIYDQLNQLIEEGLVSCTISGTFTPFTISNLIVDSVPSNIKVNAKYR